MKKLLILIAAVTAISNAHAVSCVYTKAKQLPNYHLALYHPITVYRDPDTSSESRQITEPAQYYVTARKDGFIKLADPKVYEHDQARSFAGWAKKADFDSIPSRNCILPE